MARASRTSEPTEPTVEDVVEATDATTPEPTEPTTDDATEATDGDGDDATETDPTEVAAERWNDALDAADDDGLVPVDVVAELVNAYNALPGRVAPAEFRSRVQSETVARAMADPTDPDRRVLTAMGSLLTTLSAADASPATAPVDPVEPWANKVRAVATLAAELVDAIPSDPYGDGTVRDAVRAAVGDELDDALSIMATTIDPPADDDEDALANAWRAASFGGRTPRVDRIGSTGGGRTTKGRDLANVPDGPVTYTYKGDTFTAEIDGDEMVTEDGERHGSPTGAARHVNGGTSVNGWTAWGRDGRDLSDVHDDAS